MSFFFLLGIISRGLECMSFFIFLGRVTYRLFEKIDLIWYSFVRPSIAINFSSFFSKTRMDKNREPHVTYDTRKTISKWDEVYFKLGRRKLIKLGYLGFVYLGVKYYPSKNIFKKIIF